MAQKARGIPEPYRTRIARVRADLAARKLDGLLITNYTDQLWLTGFTGEDGHVLLTARQVVLLTDGRFDETADREAPWARKVLRKKRTPDATARQFAKHDLARVGYDPNHLSVATFTALRKSCRPTSLLSAAGLITRHRLIKTAGEIAAIRRAIAVAEKAFVRAQRYVRPGRSERQVAARLVYEMEQLGATGASFPPIVAAGASASLPHYTPGERLIRDRQGLLVDWGARVGGYVSDLTRVIRVGSIPRRLETIYAVVAEAHDRAIAALRAGISASRVDKAARDVIRRAGFGRHFNHALGHGIGLDVHEGPRLAMNSDDHLAAGMVVTIEPGVYLPGYGGVRIESDVLVTETGCEVLSSLPI